MIAQRVSMKHPTKRRTTLIRIRITILLAFNPTIRSATAVGIFSTARTLVNTAAHPITIIIVDVVSTPDLITLKISLILISL